MGDFLLDYTANEINKKLGEIDNKLETVSWNDLTDTNQNGYYQCDKTVEEICDSFNAGKTIIGALPNKHKYICTYSTGTVPYFTCITGKKDELWYDTYDGNWRSIESMDSDSFETIEDNKNNFATEAYVDTNIIGHEISYNQLKDKPFYYDEYTVKDKTDTHIWSFPCSHEFVLEIYANKGEGEEYRLVFDGDYYILDSFSTSMAIGNTSLLQNVSGFNDVERQDTGEPFCITYCGSSALGASYRMYTKEDGVHSFCIEIVKPTPYTKQLDEKFIPDTIARTDDLTILPIERLADFGIEYNETLTSGSSGTAVRKNIAFNANALADISKYVFRVEASDNYSMEQLRLYFGALNPSDLKAMMNLNSVSSFYRIINDKKNKELSFINLTNELNSYVFSYDNNGDFLSFISLSNVNTYNILTSLNSKTKSDSYSPTADTDVATKKYVDDLSQSFILNSSTEGSNKRFQITVDDTGTITAKEITS